MSSANELNEIRASGEPVASDDVFVFPASFAQQRLWFLDKLDPGQGYNVPLAVRLTGDLHADVLDSAIRELISRHEVLRTTFSEDDSGRPVQLVSASSSFSLPFTDLQTAPADSREDETRRLVIEQVRQPFDLKKGPLFRAALFRLTDRDHVLSLAFHHTIVDGGSTGILLRELSAVYDALEGGRPSPLAALPIQYGDYATWQQESLRGEFLEKLLTYWRNNLRGAPPVLDLPTDFVRPPQQTFSGAHESMAVPRSVEQALLELSKKEGATLFMTLLASFSLLLSRYSGQEDIVVGSPISGRTRSELEGLIGFFVNTLPLRADLSGNPTFRKLLGRVRETALQGYAHQDLPFEKLVEELNPERNLSYNPIMQVMFTFDSAAPQPKAQMSNLAIAPFRGAEGMSTKFDLSLNAQQNKEGLKVGITYNVDLFAPATIARMLEHFRVLLSAITENPDLPVGDLRLLTDEERTKVLIHFNRPVEDEPLYPATVKDCLDRVALQELNLLPLLPKADAESEEPGLQSTTDFAPNSSLENSVAAARKSVPCYRAIPLSYAQQRLWPLDRISHKTLNMSMILRLTGVLRLSALRRTINRIVEHRDSLRTWFMLGESGSPVPKITPSLELDLGMISLTGFPESVRETEARRLVLAQGLYPFDLTVGPLIRATLLQLSDVHHLLVLNMHQMVVDRWSLELLAKDFQNIYEQEAQGTVRGDGALSVQYSDYAAWQQEILSGEVLDQHLRYWKEKLSGAPAGSGLPDGWEEPAELNAAHKIRAFDIAPALSEDLRLFSRQQGTTLFTTLLAAFDVLLSHHSGQSDIVIGSPVSGRSHRDLEDLVGPCEHTVPFRTKVDGENSFRYLLEDVRETVAGAYAHQDIPFGKIVELLEKGLNPAAPPSVIFVLRHTTSSKKVAGPLEILGMSLGAARPETGLILTATESRTGIRFHFEYAASAANARRIENLQRHFPTLLAAIVANPDSPVADLALVESERQQVLVDWNATQTLAPSTLLHEFVQKQVWRTPNAVALIDGTARVSYRELNSRANQLAHKLQKLGVGPEVLVAVCMERSADMIVALLAVLKAGGAYVPLDPMYPRDRVAKILEDSRAKVMITQEPLASTLPPHSAEVLYIDHDWSTIAAESDEDLTVPVTARNLAYVLFTSGSTGRPKGVAVEHRSVSVFVQWAQKVFTPEELSGTLFGTSICFDLSIFEMFVPLSMGGTVILAQNALALKDLPAAKEVRLINTVPSAIAELLRTQAVPSSVLTVNLAGEALPESLARDIYEQTRVRRLYNLYGPTEDTTYSTYTLVPRNGDITIGHPIANTQAYILDARRQPTPIGMPGELYLAGDGLARGYYGRDDLTNERFVPNAFSTEPYARMYRTGDRCRYREDGAIEYLGRIDNQVKLRGFRIELGEIESLLVQHPALQQAVAAVREDTPGDKRLVSYVVPKSGQQISVPEIRDYLRQGLPDYMVPSALVELDALPLTPNGKVDRKALPKPEMPKASAGTVVAPRNVLEEGLLSIWQRVLRNPAMGVTDNFFDLGGHSLMAAQLVSEMEKVFRRKIPLAALFRGASVEEMARVLREGTEAVADPIVMRIQAGRSTPFFAVVAPGMSSIGYATLAQAMGPQQTFYKLQSHRAVKPNAPISLDEMRAIARDYVQAMKTVQPKGPYYLGGMCAGTHIGEQMVLQLEAEGEKVALLAVFDTWVRQNSHVRWKWRIHYYRQRVRGLLRLGFRDQVKMVREALSKKLHRVATLQKPVETSWGKLYWPGEDFQTPHYQAPVALFKRPKQPFYYVNDDAMGWGERSRGGVYIYRIDFPHQMLREPYVRELAKHLLEAIPRTEPVPVERLQLWPKVNEPTSSAIDVEA